MWNPNTTSVYVFYVLKLRSYPYYVVDFPCRFSNAIYRYIAIYINIYLYKYSPVCVCIRMYLDTKSLRYVIMAMGVYYVFVNGVRLFYVLQQPLNNKLVNQTDKHHHYFALVTSQQNLFFNKETEMCIVYIYVVLYIKYKIYILHIWR